MDCHFDRKLAEKYKNESQRIRVMTEAWVEKNVSCLRCWNGVLVHLPRNAPLGDFACTPCGNQYELKSKRGRVGRRIIGGSYEKCIERIMCNDNPDWLVMSYDAAELCVEDLWFVPKHFFVPNIVKRRKPLSSHAKRSGWIGCNILFDMIPPQGKIQVVRHRAPVAETAIKRRVELASRLHTKNLGARGWLLDVLSCVNSIKGESFTLEEMYSFEQLLLAKHPENNNVKAKIRQQLQILRDRGFIEFLGRGNYVKKV